MQLGKYEIEANSFRILEINGAFDLTTANSSYNHAPEDGGIKVVLKRERFDIKDGQLLVTQICPYHTLEIVKNDGEFTFQSTPEVFRDTLLPSSCHYTFYNLKDGIVYDQSGSHRCSFEFFDAPYLELFDNWNEVTYQIKFETWFQMRVNPQSTIMTISKFDWFLNVKTKKVDGLWEILHQNCSTEMTIRNSLKEIDQKENGLDPCGLPHLNTAVENFRTHNNLRKRPGTGV